MKVYLVSFFDQDEFDALVIAETAPKAKFYTAKALSEDYYGGSVSVFICLKNARVKRQKHLDAQIDQSLTNTRFFRSFK